MCLLVTQLEDLFVAYLEVFNYEVPLVMCPVIQATGRRIVHTWVWLHLMLTFAYSGQPLPTHCSTQFTSVLRGSRVLATWRSDSALSSESSKNARQWHFIRAEGSSNGSWRSRRALQPTCRSRRAFKPTCQSRRAGCSESARGIWIVVSSFGIARLYLVVSGIGKRRSDQVTLSRKLDRMVCGTGETESSCAFLSQFYELIYSWSVGVLLLA